jgi:tetratricopeptide (TPR) repeat protein
MAGNREAFEQHMNVGLDAAWEQDWETAIRAYSQAIQEFPEDPEAHTHLGLALLNSDRLDDSLKVYTRAHKLSPDDPTPLEKSADVLERMGQLKEAAHQYVKVADAYLGQKDLDKAISNWERATQLTPGLISIHSRLAQAYARIGDKPKAVREYLMLAYNFARMGQTGKSEKALERALRLERRNTQALNMLRAIKAGGEVQLPEFDDLDIAPPPPTTGSFVEDDNGLVGVGEADPLGPMGEAMNNALVTLADNIVERGDLDAAGGDALQAMALQRQDMLEQAIESYLRADQHIHFPALKMNLGVLLFMVNEPEEAIKHLTAAVSEPEFSAGALHAMGYSYFNLGKQKQASRFLIQSLQAVETGMAMDEHETGELTEIYSRLLGALGNSSDEMLSDINTRFIDLLKGNDWKQRIADTRRHLEEIMSDQGAQGAVEFLGTGGSSEIASSVSHIDSYIRQGLLTLAMDAAHDAVQSSPYYLPVHVRMAEIMMREGRLRQAINKYNIVARAYMAREENDRAASILDEVLEMAPLDVTVRLSLIGLLESENRTQEALGQYIKLAQTYNQLGNFDLSHETYQRTEQLAIEYDAPTDQMITIKHSLADIDYQLRFDTRSAIRTYEEIIELDPEDERAYRALVDMNYSLANQVDAIKYLDKLLGICARRKQISKIVQLLEELVKLYPTDTGLRSRLAAIYKQLGRKREAIEQLDALGELQLEANMHTDARRTIKQIVALKPDNIEDYRQLLEKMGGE